MYHFNSSLLGRLLSNVHGTNLAVSISVHSYGEGALIGRSQQRPYLFLGEMQVVRQELPDGMAKGTQSHLIRGAVGFPQQHGTWVLAQQSEGEKL